MILSFLCFQEVYLAKETKTFSQWVMEKLLHQNVERSNFFFEFPSISPPSPCGEFKVLYWAKKRQILSQKALIFALFPQPPSSISSSAARMYSTLLQRTKTSPRFPVHEPSMNSSVLASCRFM